MVHVTIIQLIQIMRISILLFLLLSTFLLVLSCENKYCCEPPPICCNNAPSLYVSLVNSKGEDLLNQENEIAFKVEDFRVFHYYNDNNYFINNSNQPNQLRKLPNDNLTSYFTPLSTHLTLGKSTTIVKWNNKVSDTIEAEFSSENIVSRLIINHKEIIESATLKDKKVLSLLLKK